MTKKNTAHLAGEFLVAGELSRRGYPVSITMGNAKSVDIYAEAGNNILFNVDAKASRVKTDWLISGKAVRKDIFYIFVYLRKAEEVNKNLAPEYFIAKGEELLSRGLIKYWGNMQGVQYSSLNTTDYKERWDKLPSP